MKTLSEQMEEMGLKKQIQKDLEKAYDEALKNKHFKELVEKLNMDRKLLMKYTTLLEESSLDYANCKKCKSLLECKNKITGYAYLPMKIDGNLEFGYQACSYQQKLQQETAHLKNVYFFDMPEELKNAKISDIYMEDERRFPLIVWINNFVKNYVKDSKQKGLYLHGSFGSGKTYLIAAAFNELAKENIRSAIIYWPEFLRDLKSSFDTDFSEKFDYIKKIPLLLIDDIGAETVTEWGRDEILGPILQYRMQQHLTTFFTSNLDLKTLEQHLSITRDGVSKIKARRIIERINQLTEEQKLISKNFRK